MVKEFTNADKALMSGMPEPLINPDPWFCGLIYGDAGRHKTVTSCTLGRTLVLATDPGWKSLRNHPAIWANCTVIPFEGFKQLELIARAFYFQIPPYTNDNYDTVVVDSIAQVQDNYVDDILRAGHFSKKEGGRGTRPVFEADDEKLARSLQLTELPGNDDFHAAKNILRDPVRTLNKAPVNVIYICHENVPSGLVPKDSSQFYRMIRPNVTEALYKIIFYDADVVGRTTKSVSGDYMIDFNGSDTQAGKSRVPSLNDRRIKAENFPKYIKRWQGDFAKWEVPSFQVVEFTTD